MGTFGSGLFHDDAALDVRDAYLDLLKDGTSGLQATRILLKDMKEEFADYDEGPICWLALAVTQWKVGRLEERVKKKALQLITSGLAIKRCRERAIEDSFPQQYQKTLDGVIKTLRTKQPKVKKFAKPRKQFVDDYPWQAGGILAYRLNSGKYVLFLSLDTTGIFAFLNWCGKKIPPITAVEKLKLAKKWEEPFILSLIRNSAKYPDPDRIHWLECRRDCKNDPELKPYYNSLGEIGGGYGIADWYKSRAKHSLYIDDRLKREFGWE